MCVTALTTQIVYIKPTQYRLFYRPAELCRQWTDDVKLATHFSPLTGSDITDI